MERYKNYSLQGADWRQEPVSSQDSESENNAMAFKETKIKNIVMSKVSCDEMRNMDMIVELLRPQLEVTKEDIEPVIIMGLYHHHDLVGSPNAFIKAI